MTCDVHQGSVFGHIFLRFISVADEIKSHIFMFTSYTKAGDFVNSIDGGFKLQRDSNKLGLWIQLQEMGFI